MRYGDGHKAETRQRVLRAASAAIRTRGPDGVGLAEIMAEAGLTHGGFYNHFANKEALVAAAVEDAFAQSRRRFDRLTKGLAPDQALVVFLDAYVSREHRDRPDRGCPVSALAGDLARQGPAVRAAFDAGVAALLDRLTAWLAASAPGGETARRALAASLLAEMAGVVALSRAIGDRGLADAFLAGSRAALRARAGLPDPDEAASASNNCG